jgi:hypothetical protein
MKRRESRYVTVAKIADGLAQATLPRYSHPKSPHRFTQPQLAACVLMMFYLKLTYRDMEEFLLAADKVCEALELRQVPDYSTLWYAHQRLLKMKQLDDMNRHLLERLEIEEEVISADSTGYRLSPASASYDSRRGRTCRAWRKGAYAVGTRSQFILAWRQGPGNDAVFLKPLRREARRFARSRHWLLLADSGFDGQDAKPGDLIPPVRRHGKIVAPERLARADLVSATRLDGLYGQRWKSETVNAVIQRKFGDAIRAHLPRLQHREPAIKGLIYNIHR